MDYDTRLREQFGNLKIMLVAHDTSATGTGLPCYIEAHLGCTPKDKGSMVLDLGNYIYRATGLSYQMTPEYRGRGKKTTLRWFMSWRDVAPILPNIYAAVAPGRKVIAGHIPYEFNSLIIQDAGRSVYAPNQGVKNA